MAFNVTGYNATTPYPPNYGTPRRPATNAVPFGHMVPSAPAPNPTFPASNFNTPPYPPSPYQTATPNYSGIYSTIPKTSLFPQSYTQPPISYPAPSLNTGIGGYRPPYAAPANPYARPAYNPAPYYTAPPTIIYAMPPEITPEQQRKKYWSKFALNTGSTLAGLGLAAYFGMKILPKAIVGEMGTQVKHNLLPSKSRKDLLEAKLKELLKSPDTPKSVKDLLSKDPATLNRWQLAKREKLLLESCESSEVGAKFLQDCLERTWTQDFSEHLLDKTQVEEQLKKRFSNLTSDKKFMAELKKNVLDNFATPSTKELTATLLESIRENGGWLGKFIPAQPKP